MNTMLSAKGSKAVPVFTKAETLEIIEFMSFKTDCITCHQPDLALVGPSFIEIAEKYEKRPMAEALIARSIRLGSEGEWGDVPMAPHPELTTKEIAWLTDWIMSLATHGYVEVDTTLIY